MVNKNRTEQNRTEQNRTEQNRMGAGSSLANVNYGYHDETFIKEGMEKYKEMWDEKIGRDQTSFFREVVPLDEVDFCDTFVSTKLNEFFTGEPPTKIAYGYNCNHLFRSSRTMPYVVLFNDDNYTVVHPMGEPGRDMGNTDYRVSHMMVVKHNEEGPITFNEFFPSSQEETDDLKSRNDLLAGVYERIKNNVPLDTCGDKVIQKARDIGASPEMGIRDFLIEQILHLTPEFRSERPGYKLLNSEGVDICDDRASLTAVVESVFSGNMDMISCIQGPHKNTQLLSHIHSFLLEPGNPILRDIHENYVCTKMIYKIKVEMNQSDDGGALCRQNTTVG